MYINSIDPNNTRVKRKPPRQKGNSKHEGSFADEVEAILGVDAIEISQAGKERKQGSNQSPEQGEQKNPVTDDDGGLNITA